MSVGIENLKPFDTLSEEEQRQLSIKGGIASGKAKAERKTFKETLLLLLAKGEIQNDITLAQIDKALKGDTKAFEVIRDTIGEKPVEKAENLNKNIEITMSDELKELSE